MDTSGRSIAEGAMIASLHWDLTRLFEKVYRMRKMEDDEEDDVKCSKQSSHVEILPRKDEDKCRIMEVETKKIEEEMAHLNTPSRRRYLSSPPWLHRLVRHVQRKGRFSFVSSTEFPDYR